MELPKIINFFFEIASLRRLIRSHSQVIGRADDNISDHSFRVAIIGQILAKMEKANEDKVLKMGLFHDIPEARTSDANFINKQYSELKEKQAIEDQMENLPIAKEIKPLLEEFNQGETKEAKIAKDADYLDQMVLQQEYFFENKENLKIWQDFTEKKLKTKSAKELAQRIRKTNPFQWMYSLAEKKIGYKID